MTPSPGVHQLLFVRGSASGLRLSPDGTRLLFVSSRGDHSLIGVYTFASRGRALDRSRRRRWTTTPSGRRTASPSHLSRDADRLAHRGPLDARGCALVHSHRRRATGLGREVWRAGPGPGSLFHGVTAHDQLLWTKRRPDRLSLGGRRLDAPLRSLTNGASAPHLLTPGEFEVDAVADAGQHLVLSAHNVPTTAQDADRRHVWSIDLTASRARRCAHSGHRH